MSLVPCEHLGRVCVLAQQGTVWNFIPWSCWSTFGQELPPSYRCSLNSTQLFDPTASVPASLRFLAPQSFKQIDTAVDLRYPVVNPGDHVGILEDEGGSTDALGVAVGTTVSQWDLSCGCKKYTQISYIQPGGRLLDMGEAGKCWHPTWAKTGPGLWTLTCSFPSGQKVLAPLRPQN